jgi:parallel beta-helix repeat protein
MRADSTTRSPDPLATGAYRLREMIAMFTQRALDARISRRLVLAGAVAGGASLLLRPLTRWAWAAPPAGANYIISKQGDLYVASRPGPSPSPSPSPTTFTFSPDADARIAEATPDTNFGTSTTLDADNAADPDKESYLRFTVTGTSGTIQSAKLRLFVSNGSANGPAIYSTDNTWTETGITWNNRPPRTSGATDNKGAVAAGGYVEWDVTSLVNGNGTYNFVLAADSSDALIANSRNNSSNRPELVVTTSGSPSQGPSLSPTDEVVTSSTSLKTVMTAIRASNTWYHFTAGTFDYGTISSSSDKMKFVGLAGMTFTGEGMGSTILQNNGGSLAADTEVFDMVRCNGTAIRDMTIRARGTQRESSDAVDFDNSSNCLIERVKVDVCERGDGIVFDGKDANATAQSNIIRNCIVTGARYSGIQFWAVENSEISNCTLDGNGAGTGGSGIWISKASASAAQLNKKSRANKVTGGSMSNNYGFGIRIQSSDECVVDGVRANNNGRAGSGRAGVRITTINGITADRNQILNSTCTDTQATKTQSYGVHIGPAIPTEANGTVVRGCNLAGNRSTSLRDNGTGTIDENNIK